MPSRPRRQLSQSQTAIRPQTTSAPSSIPQVFTNYVPICAQSCLSTYIDQQYDCAYGDASCLCSQYGSSGYTLGELALVCLTLECPPASAQDSANARAKAYNVCSAQTDAASATQQTLTPPATTSAIFSSTSSPIIPTTSMTSTATATQSTNGASATTTGAPAQMKSGRTALTNAQAIGISIAAVGFLLIAVGFFYVLACIRRRKRKAALRTTQRHSYDFVDDASAPGLQHAFAHFERPVDDLNIASGAAYASEKRNTNWPTVPVPAHSYYGHEKKISQDRQTGRSASPESFRSRTSSMRTTSQLLPEKPSGLLLRPPPRSPELGNMRTPATIFEEDRLSAQIAPPIPSLPKNPRQPQYAYQFTKSADRTTPPSLTLDIPKQISGARPLKSFETSPAPQMPVQHPFLAHPPALMPGQLMPTFPPPPTFSQSVQRFAPAPTFSQSVQTFAPPPVSETRPVYERSMCGDSSNSVLDYYAGPEEDSPTDLYSSTPIEDENQIRRAAPAAIAISKPSYPPIAVRGSMTSEESRRTSFESTDPDEPTPPEEDDKRLTPVKEAASPIADIRYPKIPRSANQSIPRSPVYQSAYRFPTRMDSRLDQSQCEKVQHRAPEVRHHNGGHTASWSGSSLVAKRRGDTAANKLHITTITSNGAIRTPPTKDSIAAYMRDPPLKGFGRSTTSARSTPDWPLKIEMRTRGDPGGGMKSPLWEPKLTPRREGDDLYLSVSVATPLHAHFPRR